MRLSRAGAAALVSLAVACALPVTASAGAGSRIIFGDRSLGGLVIAWTTATEAIAHLGPPTLRRAGLPYSCVMRWKPLGLALDFVDLDRRKPCVVGALITATVTSRAGWRTSLGLRVGDTAARAHALYPHAPLHPAEGDRSGYWLITRHTCAEVGADAFPGLLARLSHGRISALVAGASVCE